MALTKTATLLALMLMLLLPLAPVSAQISGVVRIQGAAPENPRQVADLRLGLHDPLPTWGVGAEGELQWAVVYIDFGNRKPPASVGENSPAVLELSDRQFRPHVVCVHTGGRLTFSNRDVAEVYTVLSSNSRRRHPIGQVVRPSLGPIRSAPLDIEERFALVCLQQPSMSVWVCVFAHPYFAVTKADGSFQMSQGLPDGEYEFVVWHESGQTLRKSVTIANGKGTVEFALPVPISSDRSAPRTAATEPALKFVK